MFVRVEPLPNLHQMLFHFLGVLQIKVSTGITQRENLGFCIQARRGEQPDVVRPRILWGILRSYENSQLLLSTVSILP